MRVRLMAVFLGVVLVWLPVSPAAGADVGELGTLLLTAKAGKQFAGSCTLTDQSGNPTGEGFGLPVLNGNKAGWWTMRTTAPIDFDNNGVPEMASGTLHTLRHGPGTFEACGRLDPQLSFKKSALGAACGMVSGNSGFGKMETVGGPAGGPLVKYFRNLGWGLTAGVYQPMMGRTADPTTGKAMGHAVFMMFTSGSIECFRKSGAGQSKSGGDTHETVWGAFALAF